MAIHEDLPGISVTLLANGQPLEEYPTDNDEPQHPSPDVRLHHSTWTTTNYVEALTDAEFIIRCEVEEPFEMTSTGLGFEVEVDGEWVRTPFVRQGHYQRVRRWETLIDGLQEGVGINGWVRPLRFARIETITDDIPHSDINEDRKRVSKVGEVVVKVYCETIGAEIPRYQSASKLGEANFGAGIHEKALKGEAKSHGVTLGDAKPVILGTYNQVTFVDGTDYPIAIFRFKYRSNEALKQLLIIERTPSPEPDIMAGLTAAERREMEALAKRLMRKRNGSPDLIKSEHDENPGSRGGFQKRRKSVKEEVIDLTGDDKNEEDGSPFRSVEGD